MSSPAHDRPAVSLDVLSSARPRSIPQSILDRMYIAAPCSVEWDAMVGDEKRRFCSQCRLNVINLSAMSQSEAEEFVADSPDRCVDGERVCVQFYRRADGTILTRDCPVGVAARARQSVRGMKITAVTLAGLVATSLFATLRLGPHVWWLQTDSLSRSRPFSAVASIVRASVTPVRRVPIGLVARGAMCVGPSVKLTPGANAVPAQGGVP